MIGRCRALSAPTYSSSNRSGWLKSTGSCYSCQRAADGVPDVDVDLGAVEGGVALLDLVRRGRDARAPSRSASVAFSQISSVPTDFFGSFVDRLAVKSSKPNARSTRQHEVEQRRDLVLELLLGAEDVAVVLREAADAHQPVQRAGPLVAVHRAELEQPQRQLAVAALPAAEDEAVHRAVHRLQVVRAVVHLHRRVHAVLVPVEVARCLEQRARWPGAACTRTGSRRAAWRSRL